MVELAATDHGEDHGGDTGGDRPPLLVVHGLFGSGRNWGAVARRLAADRRVRTVDMRNHGASPRTESHSYAGMAEDLAGAIDDGWDVVGHSMGGKAAMALALTRPERVRRLVVADIAPVAYDHSQAHLIEAMKALDLSAIETRADADAALAEHVDEPGVRAFLLQSLDVRKGRWMLNLDTLGREMDAITGWPGDMGGTFERPALFLSGAESDYVTDAAREPIGRLFPKARFAAIPGAGHWLHAEKPRETEAAIRNFLDAGISD